MQAVLHPAKPLMNERQQIKKNHGPPTQVITSVLLTILRRVCFTLIMEAVGLFETPKTV
jgi:hypothetical protein